MAQHNWAYTSGSGKQYVVGLYHGAESGHLMVYCNLSVIYIDFSVLHDWTYSFFIEDDLLELKIARQGEQFHYHFDVNRQVDTPLNRARKLREREDFRKLVLMGIALLVAIIIGIWAWRYNEKVVPQRQAAAWLAQYGRITPAKVFPIKQDKLRYTFVALGQRYEQTVPDPGGALLPLQAGDEFIVEYASNQPKVSKIRLDRPTERQTQRYQQRAFFKHAQLHPELDSLHILCLLELAYAQKGVGAYADFYYQQTEPAHNATHNRNTYGRLVRDVPFQQMVAERCR